MRSICRTAALILAVTLASVAQAPDGLKFTRPTAKGYVLASSPKWDVEIYRDDAYQFVYRHYGNGEYVPGLFAHDLIRDRWLEITHVSTENARLGRSPDFWDIPLQVSWDFHPLAQQEYARLPLKTSGSIVFPDRITFFSASDIYRLDCNSELNREASLTLFWLRKADMAQFTDATSGDNSYELRRDIGPKLHAILPDEWSISYGVNSIILTRNRKVFLYSTVNWPAVSGETMDELVRRFGEEITYRITLRFINRLTHSEYAILKTEWNGCHIDNRPGPSFSIEKWSKAQECYRAKQPPIYYSKNFSVYVDQPDWWSELEIYPASAANESKRVHESMDKIFNRYERVSKLR